MPSKHDFYWQKRLGEIKDLLKEAYEKGVSRQIAPKIKIILEMSIPFQ